MVDAQDNFPAEPNGQFPFASEAVRRAASAGEFDTVRRLVREGAKLNVIAQDGDSLLEEIVLDLVNESSLSFQASDMVRLLLELGADPNLKGPDDSVALFPAMLNMDTPILEALLEGGANPNPPGGVCEGDNLYDWAAVDYELHVWGMGDQSPLAAHTEGDVATEDAWLAFVDRMALKHGVRRPDHLMLLRRYGAKTGVELKEADVMPRRERIHLDLAPEVLPSARSLEDAINFLNRLIRDGWDWSDLRLPDHLEALHNQHCNEPTFMALFEQAAHVYSDAVVAKAKEVLRSMGLDHQVGR
ncbi:ankyrin repeat domain-containing protein [Pseudomonas kuykendallii]|uniref:ankyrin repeat domain-containing protein n=1 Tax=Pseudomonas kuykendallii TaxID=1007099 RepID=UPI0028D5D8AB|nr:ankyrin repeat domain-containing protein [Pseudomonas kuykendallii]